MGDVGPKWITDLTMRAMDMPKELTEQARADIVRWLDQKEDMIP